MKKLLFTLTCVITALASCFTVSAAGRSLVNIYTKDGEEQITGVHIITNCIGSDNTEIQLSSQPQLDAPSEDLLGICSDYDYMLTYDFKTNDESNLYPDVKELQVRITPPQAGGGRGPELGRNFRLYYIGAETAPEQIDFDIIAEGISFTTTKLGRYALYFDEAVYDVTFYSDLPSFNEYGEFIDPELYVTLKDLKANDQIVFPEIPQKAGYVFTGWKTRSGIEYAFVEPQPHTALNPSEYYASWCAEDEYSPLEIHATADMPITKGKEDGQTVTLKLSDGFFDIAWEDLFYTGNWKLTGTDEVTIGKVEAIDNKTVRLTLSGNSKNVYSTTETNVEFNNQMITFEIIDDSEQLITEPEKVQLDKDGVKAAWYKTADTITLKGQNRPSSGGSASTSSFTIKFNSNGGKSIAPLKIKRNETISLIEIPTRDGFIFDGWYTDKSLTKPFELNTKITSSMILYAKWIEKTVDKTENQLILTIGKTDVSVFGETKENDVAPFIRNEHTMLPARFVAENLGATVSWNEEKQLVTINGKNEKNENVTILITIGAEYAEVNGEKIKLDTPAFIENDRTYTPIRFISEQLGAKVDWNENEQKIIITVSNEE